MGKEMINEIKRFASELEWLFEDNNITESENISVMVFPKYERVSVNYCGLFNHSELYKEIPNNAGIIENGDTGNFIATWTNGNINFTAYLTKSIYNKWMELKENMYDAKKGSM